MDPRNSANRNKSRDTDVSGRVNNDSSQKMKLALLMVANAQKSGPVEDCEDCSKTNPCGQIGLGVKGTRVQYVQRIVEIAKNGKRWRESGETERRSFLEKAINEALKAAGVPEIFGSETKVYEDKVLTIQGEFKIDSWRIYINSKVWTLVNTTESTVNNITNLAATYYHEARHGEQHFLAARYAIGFKKGNVKVLGIHPNVLEQARAAGMIQPGHPYYKCAQILYEHIVENKPFPCKTDHYNHLGGCDAFDIERSLDWSPMRSIYG